MLNEKIKKMTSKFTRENSNHGITLIALIITIIVMLILVIVTLTIALGENGIIKETKKAKREQAIAEISERIELAKAASYDANLENLLFGAGDEITDEEAEEFKAQGYIVSGYYNMQKIKSELDNFKNESKYDMEIVLSNTYDERMRAEAEEEEALSVLETMDYEQNYNCSIFAAKWLEYMLSKEAKGKTNEYVKEKADQLEIEIFGEDVSVEENLAYPSDEIISQMTGDKQATGGEFWYAFLWLTYGNLRLYSYTVTVTYDDMTWVIYGDDSMEKFDSQSGRNQMSAEQARMLFDWVYLEDEKGYAITAIKERSNYIVIPERIGSVPVVQLGYYNSEYDAKTSIMGFTQTMSIQDVFKAPLSEETWSVMRDQLLQLTPNFADELNAVTDLQGFIGVTKAYEKVEGSGDYYVTVKIGNSGEVEEFLGKDEGAPAEIVLPQTIKKIADHCFEGANIWKINIPAAVTEIGYAAFRATPLTSLIFDERTEDSTLSIRSEAFDETNITSVTLPQGNITNRDDKIDQLTNTLAY